MFPTLRAGFGYFAMVLGSGFLCGMIRVPLLVPRLGERWAELAEMPVMGTVIYFAARYIVRRYPEGRLLAVGGLALAMSVVAELGLAVAMQSRTLGEYIASRDPVSGAVYLGMLGVFAVLPWGMRRYS